LLDLSRIESGGWRPTPEQIDLDDSVRQAWEPFAARAASCNVKLETDIASTARSVSVDPDALRQILTNLIDNALRHTPDGGRIRIAARADQRGVALVVEDSGSGIPAEHLPRIFERFYRVDAGRARHHGGTGLGLAIVKHLVEAHGGRIEAQSAVGRGTTVRLTLPA
jgi:signal transduction histidine kinase